MKAEEFDSCADVSSTIAFALSTRSQTCNLTVKIDKTHQADRGMTTDDVKNADSCLWHERAACLSSEAGVPGYQNFLDSVPITFEFLKNGISEQCASASAYAILSTT